MQAQCIAVHRPQKLRANLTYTVTVETSLKIDCAVPVQGDQMPTKWTIPTIISIARAWCIWPAGITSSLEIFLLDFLDGAYHETP